MTNNIQRYTLTTGAAVAVGVGAASRILIRANGDVRLALGEQNLSNDQYFTINDGSTIVFDPPNYIQGYFIWAMLDSAATGSLEVWLQGVSQ